MRLLIILILSAAICLPLLEAPFLSFDDYRYLQDVGEIKAGVPGALPKAMVVENRWDQHWWIPDGTAVRFFRPLVIVSYLFDDYFWKTEQRGPVVSNIFLHLLVVALLYGCLSKLFDSKAGAFLGALSFGLHPAHFENVFYIAGRTDTIAGVFFLAFFFVYLHYRDSQSTFRFLLLLLTAFLAFISKEYNVLLLPLMVLLDLLLSGRKNLFKNNGTAYLGTAVIFLCYCLLRSRVLGEGGSGGMPYPYFYLPAREGFTTRTLAILVQYFSSLSVGTTVQPFLNNAWELFNRVGIWELWLGVVAFIVILLSGFVSKKGVWLGFVVLLTLAPLLPLYSSARYLYLPSIGYCAVLGLLLGKLFSSSGSTKYVLFPLVCLFFLVVPALRLLLIYENFPKELTAKKTPAQYYAQLFKASDLALEPKRPVFLVDFPGNWATMQFFPDALDILLEDSLPPFFVLSQLPPKERDSFTKLKREAGGSIILSRAKGLFRTASNRGIGSFEPRALFVGDLIDKEIYQVEVLKIDEGVSQKIKVKFDDWHKIELGKFSRDAQGKWQLKKISFSS